MRLPEMLWPQTPETSATLTLPLSEPILSWLCRLSLGLRIMPLHQHLIFWVYEHCYLSLALHSKYAASGDPNSILRTGWLSTRAIIEGRIHVIHFHRGSWELRKWECSWLFLFSAKPMSLKGSQVGLFLKIHTTVPDTSSGRVSHQWRQSGNKKHRRNLNR